MSASTAVGTGSETSQATTGASTTSGTTTESEASTTTGSEAAVGSSTAGRAGLGPSPKIKRTTRCVSASNPANNLAPATLTSSPTCSPGTPTVNRAHSGSTGAVR